MDKMAQRLQFPDGFIWGTATASYQIEGGVQAKGRGPSIWDIFSHASGKVLQGHTGDVACDHFHRYQEDVQLMAQLGGQAYRFSLAWPRIFPSHGTYLKPGFDFYKRLLELLHNNDIEPVVTLYHWDLPQWIEDLGGWPNRDAIAHYLEFAEAAFLELGDGVSKWITLNEPWCASMLGYGMGVHAPGRTDWRSAFQAAHHLLLAHGSAVQLHRALSLPGEVGISLNLTPVYPATCAKADVEAADLQDTLVNRWFLDPLFKGTYPYEAHTFVEQRIGAMDFVKPNDLEVIGQPIDFLGVNYYTRHVVKADTSDEMLGVSIVRTETPVTEMGWEISPEALPDLLLRLQQAYTKEMPLYMTENGAAFSDTVEEREVDDPERVDYIKQHLMAVHQFIEQGGNVKGYFLWSLLDNFEWAYGYTKRFGIVYVDYDTLERIPKASFDWYRRVIKANALDTEKLSSDI